MATPSPEKPQQEALYIGLMSGTSIDGVDAALFDIQPKQATMLACHHTKFDETIKSQILALSQPGGNEIDTMGELDIALGQTFADAVKALLTEAKRSHKEILAIGSHGQTIRHRPLAKNPFSLQIGDPNTIAQLTRITTVADFRRRDMAAKGQGAPLAPAFHQAFFASESETRCVINIGGMANISVLDASSSGKQTKGYDTGPGNVLMDAWTYKHLHQAYDENGQWAASGNVHQALLQELLAHPYFAITPPKSTGREDFHLAWLIEVLAKFGQVPSEDVQATLCELTAYTVAQEINLYTAKHAYICGGGAHNKHLMSRIDHHLSACQLSTTESLGIPPDWVEAALFAWLAKQTTSRQTTKLSSITGAVQDVILGGVYFA